MKRERLVSLLAGRGSAYEECRVALRRGAAFVIYDGAVRVADPPCHFQLFVSADGSTVVACLAMAQ